MVWAVAAAVLVLASPDEARADAAEAKRLIVMIDGEFRRGQPTIGAGIIVGSAADRLYIATANHVVRQGSKILQVVRVRLWFLPGKEIEAEVLIDFDWGLDLAVLSVKGVQALAIPLESIPFQLVGAAAGLKRGDEVFTIGYPRGASWQVNVSPDRIAENLGDTLKFESQLVASGHSGGGLFDKDWNLVGMITADQPPNGVAVRIDRILEQMKRWNYPVELSRREPETPPPAQDTETPAVRREIRPSFDCAKATTEVELLLCSDADLADADRQLGMVYQSLRSRLSSTGRYSLRIDQRGWITARDLTCSQRATGMRGSAHRTTMIDCLVNETLSRTDRLRSW